MSQIFSKFEQDNKRWYEDIRNGFEKLNTHRFLMYANFRENAPQIFGSWLLNQIQNFPKYIRIWNFYIYLYCKSGSNFWNSSKERNFSWKQQMDCVKHFLKASYRALKVHWTSFSKKTAESKRHDGKIHLLIFCPQRRFTAQIFAFFKKMQLFCSWSFWFAI